MGIGWLFLIIVLVFFIASPSIADAQTNSTIIVQLDEKIIQQHKFIKIHQEELDKKNQILQQYQKDSNTSWDALLSIEDAEIDRDAATTSYLKVRNQLKLLLSERSTEIKLIKTTKQIVIDNYTRSSSTTGLTNLIGIELSKSCELSTQCLNYTDLIYLDSSNKRISGDFIEINNDTRRDKSPIEDSWRWYDYREELRIIVDPPNGMNDRIKMITLTNNLDVYFNPEDMKLVNQTRTWQVDRYVDDCRNATITVKDWKLRLQDTIDYLRTGCTITDFNSTRTEYIPLTDYDPRTSPNWLFTQWVNESKVKCLTLCFEY